MSAWRPPAESEIPGDSLGAAIRRGLSLVTNTSDSLPAYAPGKINCTSCHLDGGRNVTAAPLTGSHARFPKYMERTAYYLTAWKLGNYYRTYAEYVEDEVRRALAKPSDFARGPLHLVARGTMTNDEPTHVVEDRHYLSARWPGDAFAFARKLLARL